MTVIPAERPWSSWLTFAGELHLAHVDLRDAVADLAIARRSRRARNDEGVELQRLRAEREVLGTRLARGDRDGAIFGTIADQLRADAMLSRGDIRYGVAPVVAGDRSQRGSDDANGSPRERLSGLPLDSAVDGSSLLRVHRGGDTEGCGSDAPSKENRTGQGKATHGDLRCWYVGPAGNAAGPHYGRPVEGVKNIRSRRRGDVLRRRRGVVR